MIRQFLMDHLGTPRLGSVLILLILAVSAVIAGALWLLRSPDEPESNFKLREADRERARATPKHATSKHKNTDEDKLGAARMKQFEGVLRLEGIRIDGAPHEVLGVSPLATPDQVQKAYRELMKRFHPDRVGRPGSREWTDAQRIAEAINRAKEALLKKT